MHEYQRVQQLVKKRNKISIINDSISNDSINDDSISKVSIRNEFNDIITLLLREWNYIMILIIKDTLIDSPLNILFITDKRIF